MSEIVYISSGKPSPVILDFCNKLNKTRRTTLLFFERPNEDLILDDHLIEFEIQSINVPYSKGLFRRILYFPIILNRLSHFFRGNYPKTIIVESYDNLLILLFLQKRIDHIIFYCRDLISLQTANSFYGKLFRKIEKKLLSKVNKLLLTSPEFFSGYYREYFTDFLLYENYPIKKISNTKTTSNSIRISFIGIIRYIKSLKSVIDAIDKLITQGYKIQLNVYGGGLKEDIETISRLAQKNNFIRIRGPFQYSKEIDRIYSNTDISLAVYDSKNYNCKVAIPNKYYEALMSKTFLFVSSGTYLEKISTEMGIGIGFDPFNSSEVYLKIKRTIDKGNFKNFQTVNTLENIYQNNLQTINQILEL